MTIDEPRSDGGTNPLGYFLIGAAACFFNQIAKVIIIMDLKIESLDMAARSHFTLAKKGGHMTGMIGDVRLHGSETKEKLANMLQEAESMCFATRR